GTPYSAIGTIDARPYVTQAILDDYRQEPSGINYYFSERGEFRWDDAMATDLAINYSLPMSRVGLFAQAELINAFNDDAVTAGNTTVLTAAQDEDGTLGLSPFNPFTDAPIECPQGATADVCLGMRANWQKGSNFGKATTPTTAGTQGHYLLPRTFRVSFGLRF
ncbi:MAG: hypothetical protein ACXW2P_05120, partial [Thermoanaerobaculia bacterium]